MVSKVMRGFNNAASRRRILYGGHITPVRSIVEPDNVPATDANNAADSTESTKTQVKQVAK